jgi:error-prone DNA polymerase
MSCAVATVDATHGSYAELHCVSNFSFLRGASHPEELVERAAKLGYQALALTDECSLAGVVRAHVAAKEYNIELVVGTELHLEDGPSLILLAADERGYANLCELITQARRAANKGQYQINKVDFDKGIEGCLAILLPGENKAYAELLAEADWLSRCFPGCCWLAVELLFGPADDGRLQALEHLGRSAGLPLVASGDVHMHARSRRVLQDTVTAIRLGCSVAEAGFALFANGERHLRSRRVLAEIYPRELLERSVDIAGRCRFSLDSVCYEYPEELVPNEHSPASWLRHLTEQGKRERWPEGAPATVHQLIEHELALIVELGYEAYFLTVHDLVRFARSRNILCQGRGSAANSAVCYCLGVTEVDPARMQMLFERFISRERDEPPDIDVDFEHERREEVIQYIYGKYGRDRAALAATVITYRPKSAIRDVGKALGLELNQVERIAKSLAWWDGKQMLLEKFKEAGVDPDSPIIERLLILVGMITGFPRHLSQHVGGFVMTRSKLSKLVPIENAAMPERTVIQWDKNDLEALGLLKVDVLALGMLTAIHRAFDLVSNYRGQLLRMADVPAEDPAVYEMIVKADTVGLFQIESRAQMAMLPRLKPRTFYDLVIEVAIVRPGPIQGGMVHPYLRRRQGSEPISYPSEAVRGVLERTLGVPIFQEQVMQLAVVAAGFTPGEADSLRRAMAAWKRKGGLKPFEDRLISGMRGRGYDETFARQIFEQIKGFGEYGFPESHSASFALLVYVSAWLKFHEPAAFTCALLNSQPMGFYAPSQLLQDATKHGVEAHPVDVQISQWHCTLENPDPAMSADSSPIIRLGLNRIKGFSESTAKRLIAAREQGLFTNVQDLNRRGGLNRRDLDLLTGSGALARLAGHRHLARWQSLGVTSMPPLLDTAVFNEVSPMLPVPTEGQDLVADYKSLGLTLGRHPLDLLRSRLDRMGLQNAEAINRLRHGDRVCTAGLVINRQRPSTASGVIFMTLEDEIGSINVVLWPWVAEKQRTQMLRSRLLLIRGVIEREGDVIHVVASKLEDHTSLLGRLKTSSRDFH